MASSLIPVTINSRAIINVTTNPMLKPKAANLFLSNNTIIVEKTQSLSANGSIYLPKFVMILFFLAIYPSKKSVKDAKINIIIITIFSNVISVPNMRLPNIVVLSKIGINDIIIIIAITQILDKVSLFGKFIFFLLYSFILYYIINNFISK